MQRLGSSLSSTAAATSASGHDESKAQQPGNSTADQPSSSDNCPLTGLARRYYQPAGTDSSTNDAKCCWHILQAANAGESGSTFARALAVLTARASSTSPARKTWSSYWSVRCRKMLRKMRKMLLCVPPFIPIQCRPLWPPNGSVPNHISAWIHCSLCYQHAGQDGIAARAPAAVAGPEVAGAIRRVGARRQRQWRQRPWRQ